MKIVVADDEPRHLRGMKNLINNLRPDARVLVAKDGASALELVRLERPDVVLTDIRMPNMDGLAFLQQLKEEELQAKVVMVSAYNLFEYAQAAVRHGAYDYLLKPVEAEKVEDVLLRIEQELLRESIHHLEAEEMKLRLHHTSSAYRNRLYLTWLNGSSTILEQTEPETYDWLLAGGIVIFSEFRNRSGSHDNIESANFLGSLEQGWGTMGEAVTIPVDVLMEDGFQAVTIIRKVLLSPEKRSQIRAIVSALSSEWENSGQLIHGIGPECKSLLEEAPQAYRAAHTVNKFNFYDCWNKVLFQDELRFSKPLMTLDMEKLFEALQDNDAEAAIVLCVGALRALSDNGHTEPVIVKENVSLLLMKIKSRMGTMVDRQVGKLLTNTTIMEIQGCGSYSELIAFVEVTLQKIHYALKQARLDKNEMIVTGCLSWIQEKLKEDLSLEQAAAHFSFNTSYFSTLIKNRTGKTFSDHVTEARMRKAQLLLSANKLRIYEISAECGYQDTKYFCRVFKKYNGISPEAFKHTSLLQRRNEE